MAIEADGSGEPKKERVWQRMMGKSRRLKNMLNRSDTVSRRCGWGSTIAESSPLLDVYHVLPAFAGSEFQRRPLA
jgi:hypothetical protein